MGNSQFVGTDLTNLLNGLQAPYYFNGRLLTAEDLKQDQQATLSRQRWLGQAAGAGVIGGLLVTQAGPTSVTVTAGVGLNLQGDLISLPNDLTVPLTPQAQDTQPILDTGRFSTCDFQSISGNGGTVSAGAYLLTILPASHFKDLAPMKPVAGSTNGASSTPGCGNKWEVEGVRFKIIPIPFDVTTPLTGVTDKNRRNVLAHWCYGTSTLAFLGHDPFHFSMDYSGLDQMAQIASSDLTPCDLPLAVFYWTGTALSFVDAWSSRRRITHPMAFDGSWLALMSDKRVAENQARFLQFQEQIQDLLIAGNTPGSGVDLSQVRADDYFWFLPPIGFLPITPTSLQAKICPIFYEEVALASAATTTSTPKNVSAAQASMFSPTIQALNAAIQSMNNQIQTMRLQLESLSKPTSGTTTPVTNEAARMAGSAAPSGGGGGSSSATPASGGGSPSSPDEQLREAICPYLQYRSGSATGAFDLNQFLGNLPLSMRINLIGSDTVGLMVHSSWYEEAISLGFSPHISPPPGGGGAPPLPAFPGIIDIYLVEENLRDTSAQLYVLFHKVPHPTEVVDARAVPQG